MKKLLNQLICKFKGHNFVDYVISTGYWSHDIEQAGVCKRCGYDTHEEVAE